MKRFSACGIIFAALALLLGLAALFICISPVTRQPVLLRPSQEAQLQARQFLTAVCQGDFTGAEQYLLDTPSLGVKRPARSPAGVLFWDAFVESLSFSLEGGCFATANGLGQAVQITYLDIDATAASLNQRSQALLDARLEASRDPSQIYDEHNNYREDVVMDVFLDAVREALDQDAQYRAVTVTVNMIHRDGKWWVVPDQALLRAISGGIVQ